MNDGPAAAAELEAYILAHIPLSRTMGLAVIRYTGAELEMTAPLAPNINDKGCAFGGSMASLLTLAGWGLLELGLRAHRLDCDLYVGDSHLRYREPVWSELRAVARLVHANALEKLQIALRERGKGRSDLVCEIAGDKRPAATLEARFFAKLRG
jgi:thioesterase domain-containing protein